jgi:hypothetical protein
VVALDDDERWRRVLVYGASEVHWTSLQLRVEGSGMKKAPRRLSTVAKLAQRMAVRGAATPATDGGGRRCE